jgi:hypothetical protein
MERQRTKKGQRNESKGRRGSWGRKQELPNLIKNV